MIKWPRIKRKWDDISDRPKYITIDRRTNNLIHLSEGAIRYDFDKFNSFWDALLADYIENPTDEQLKESIAVCFAEEHDRIDVFNNFKSGKYKLPEV